MEKKTSMTMTKKQSMGYNQKEELLPRSIFSFVRKSSIKTTQVLKISNIEAKIQRSSLEQSDSTDSFVLFHHSGLKTKTQTVKKTNYPKYSDELSLNVTDLKELLEISVYEIQKKNDKETSELIGKGTKPITHLYFGEKEEVNMYLHPRVEITFKLEAVNFGRLRDFLIKMVDYSEIDLNDMKKKQISYEKLSEIHNATGKMNFDEDRLEFILSNLSNVYLLASDVSILLNCLRFRHYQYLLTEEMIPKIIDIKNYSHIKNSLIYADDRDQFEQEALYYYMKKMNLKYSEIINKISH